MSSFIFGIAMVAVSKETCLGLYSIFVSLKITLSFKKDWIEQAEICQRECDALRISATTNV